MQPRNPREGTSDSLAPQRRAHRPRHHPRHAQHRSAHARGAEALAVAAACACTTARRGKGGEERRAEPPPRRRCPLTYACLYCVATGMVRSQRYKKSSLGERAGRAVASTPKKREQKPPERPPERNAALKHAPRLPAGGVAASGPLQRRPAAQAPTEQGAGCCAPPRPTPRRRQAKARTRRHAEERPRSEVRPAARPRRERRRTFC